MNGLADARESVNNTHTKEMRRRPSSSQAGLRSHHLFLTVMMKQGYIASLKSSLDHRAGEICVTLTSTLRKVWVNQVWSPRLDVQVKDLEKLQNHLLPSGLFGVIVLMDAFAGTMMNAHRRSFSGDVIHTYEVSQCRREGERAKPGSAVCQLLLSLCQGTGRGGTNPLAST
ncbi:40S ribosomal protein S15a [Myotis davidii]|uniref:40S ribosomal protein S15a n=1 Tax=Myotis davidii TaxID=225400 RepID=L5M7I8_MYODS|nr:40S ribosomal protein S15a [Myotis davidii]